MRKIILLSVLLSGFAFSAGGITGFTSTVDQAGSVVGGVQTSIDSIENLGNDVQKVTDSLGIGGGGAISDGINAITNSEVMQNINGALDGVTGAIGMLDDVTSAIDGILGIFGGGSSPSVSGAISSIISSIGQINTGLDGLFSGSNLSSITDQLSQISNLARCFGITDKGLFDGLCGNLGSFRIPGLGDIWGDVDFLRCGGINAENLGGIGINLGNLCDGRAVEEVGQIIESAVGDVNDYDGIVDPIEIANQIPSDYGYTPTTVVTSKTGDLEAAGNGTKDNPGKDIKEVKYPSGKTGNELYADGGGWFAKKAATDPSSSSAKAWLEMDNSTLALKELALKTLNIDNEALVPLPENKADAINKTLEQAKLESSASISYEDVKKTIATRIMNKYKEIEADTVKEYYKKESETFGSIIEGRESIKDLYTAIEKGVRMKYARILFNMSIKGDYIYDPSQKHLQYIRKSHHNEFRAVSLAQMNKISGLKAKMLNEIKLRKQLLDITISRTYYSTSSFPEGAAEKEIDTLLQAVDRAIGH